MAIFCSLLQLLTLLLHSFFCEASCWWLDKEIRGSEEVHPCKSNNSWADSMLSGKGCYISVCSWRGYCFKFSILLFFIILRINFVCMHGTLKTVLLTYSERWVSPSCPCCCCCYQMWYVHYSVHWDNSNNMMNLAQVVIHMLHWNREAASEGLLWNFLRYLFLR